MVLVGVVLLAALLVGRALGGQLAGLGRLRLRSGRLVVAGLLAQLAGGLAGGPAYPVGLGVSVVLVAGFLLRNRSVRGLGLVALGLGANALVVGLNGAMPVSLSAADRLGIATGDIAAGLDPRHCAAGPGSRLRSLGDIVPVALPVRPEVVSPGDVLVAAGLGELVVAAMGAGRLATVGRDAADHHRTAGGPRWPRRPASAARARSPVRTTASAPTPDRPAP